MQRHMTALLVAVATTSVAGLGLTAEQQRWYGTCMASSERMPKMDDVFNTMCTCKQNPSVTVGPLTVDPVCLDPGYAAPQGGIQGGLAGRILWTIVSEVGCTGTAFTMYPTVVPNEPGAIVFSWMEDFNATTTERNAHSRLTKVAPNPSTGRYEIVADMRVPNCAQSGGTVFNKRGDIATLCFAVCESCSGTERLEPFVVEVDAELTHVKRRVSVMDPLCAEHDNYCYPRGRGTILQDLAYDPKRDWYAVWIAGAISYHVGDMLPIHYADPALNMRRVTASDLGRDCGSVGWSWESIKGHTTGHRLAYHPQFENFGVLVTSDLPREPGMRYKSAVGYYLKNKISENENVGQASVTWPGALIACGCHFYSAWHGVQKMGDYSREKKVQLGFGRFLPDGTRVYVKWIALPEGMIPKSVRLAVLGGGEAEGCNRFLLGWGEMQKDALYPERYMLAEVDSEGNMLTEPLDVTSATYWGEDEPWVTHTNGDVTWVSTWRRNNDGTPNRVGQDPVTGRLRKEGPQTCTNDGRNDAYGHNVLRAYTDTNEHPYWCNKDGDGNYPSWCKIWDWGTTGFKTNEMFVNRVSAAERVAALTYIGWMTTHMTPPRAEHPECERDDILKKNEYCMGASEPLPETPTPPTTPAPPAVPAGPRPPAPVVPEVPAHCEKIGGYSGDFVWPSPRSRYAPNMEACWTFSCPDVSEGIKVVWEDCDINNDMLRFEYLDRTSWKHFTNFTSPIWPDDNNCYDLPTEFGNRLSILFASTESWEGYGLDFRWECLMPVTPAPPTAEPTVAPPTAEPTVAPPTAEPTVAPPTAEPTATPPTNAPPTSAPPTPAPATSAPPTSAPPTSAPPTSVPPTSAPPTSAPATSAPPTSAPPTSAPPTSAPPTSAPPTSAPATSAPPTSAPPTSAPPTHAPATNAPPTPAPATAQPTPAPATPSPPVCQDKKLADGSLFVDIRGTIGVNKHSCYWYRRGGRCAKQGALYPREGMTASDACCVCGGGVWM